MKLQSKSKPKMILTPKVKKSKMILKKIKTKPTTKRYV